MTLDPTAAGESELLAAALRTHLSETRFSFTGLTGKDATLCITRAVAEWATGSGWRCRWEAPMRYIDPPRPMSGGCRIYWSPSWSAYLDLRLVRKEGPPVAVEIDRADDSTAVDKLRDEALRGRPALWIRWHGTLRAELPAGVARLHLPSRSSRSPRPVLAQPCPRDGGDHSWWGRHARSPSGRPEPRSAADGGRGARCRRRPGSRALSGVSRVSLVALPTDTPERLCASAARSGLDAPPAAGIDRCQPYCLVSATNSPAINARTASSRIAVYRLSS
ncbi:hypothetical protein SALBM311S_07356 [Streptomyces alboniger]